MDDCTDDQLFLGGHRTEVGVLGEEPIARVHRLGPAASDRIEDRGGVQITLGRSLAAEGVRLVRQTDVERLTVELGVDGDGFDAEFATRTDDPHRDLATVGDEDLGKHPIWLVEWRARV